MPCLVNCPVVIASDWCVYCAFYCALVPCCILRSLPPDAVCRLAFPLCAECAAKRFAAVRDAATTALHLQNIYHGIVCQWACCNVFWLGPLRHRDPYQPFPSLPGRPTAVVVRVCMLSCLPRVVWKCRMASSVQFTAPG